MSIVGGTVSAGFVGISAPLQADRVWSFCLAVGGRVHRRFTADELNWTEVNRTPVVNTCISSFWPHAKSTDSRVLLMMPTLGSSGTRHVCCRLPSMIYSSVYSVNRVAIESFEVIFLRLCRPALLLVSNCT